MTEREWLESDDPAAMLGWYTGRVGDGSRDIGNDISPRKLRLFACAILRSGEDPHPFQVYCADAAERWIEGEIALGQCLKVWRQYVNVIAWPQDAIMPEDALAWAMSLAGSGLGPPASPVDAGQHPVWAALLRDIVGNPFRPVALPAGPLMPGRVFRRCNPCDGTGLTGAYHLHQCRCCRGAGWLQADPVPGPCPWLTPAVTRLALAAYQERNPDGTLDSAQLAILSDALEEAGCHDEAVLSALRSPGPHYRGFWALDLLLGRN